MQKITFKKAKAGELGQGLLDLSGMDQRCGTVSQEAGSGLDPHFLLGRSASPPL